MGAEGSNAPRADASAGIVRLSLLRGFQLHYREAPITISRANQRLLAFLAVCGGTTRSTLAGTLWPDVNEERARASLRTATWRLTHCGHRLIDACGGRLVLASCVYVDTVVLVEHAMRLIRGADPVRHDLSELIRGDLLPDWSEDWVLVERERLRQLRLHALEALAARLVSDEQYGEALEAALEAVRIEPLRESAHRCVISVHLAEGNVVEALRCYVAFREMLLDELGVEPSKMITRLLPTVAAAPGVRWQ